VLLRRAPDQNQAFAVLIGLQSGLGHARLLTHRPKNIKRLPCMDYKRGRYSIMESAYPPCQKAKCF
jgi:hypothetical protein